MREDAEEDRHHPNDWIANRRLLYSELIDSAVEEGAIDAISAEVFRQAFDFNSELYNCAVLAEIKSDIFSSGRQHENNLVKKTDEAIISALQRSGLVSRPASLALKAFLVKAREREYRVWSFRVRHSSMIDDCILFGEISEAEAKIFRKNFDYSADIFSSGQLKEFKDRHINKGEGNEKEVLNKLIDVLVGAGEVGRDSGLRMKAAITNCQRRESRVYSRSKAYEAIIDRAVSKGLVAKSYVRQLKDAYQFRNRSGIFDIPDLKDYYFRFFDLGKPALNRTDYNIDCQIVEALVSRGVLSRKSGDGFLAECREAFTKKERQEAPKTAVRSGHPSEASGRVYRGFGPLDGKCPFCSSANIQKRSLVIAAGKRSTVGIGVSSNGAFGAGVGWSRTDLSKAADFKAPEPSSSDHNAAIFLSTIVAFLAGGIGLLFGRPFEFGIIAFLITAVFLVVLMQGVSEKSALEDREKSWFCLSCGAKF